MTPQTTSAERTTRDKADIRTLLDTLAQAHRDRDAAVVAAQYTPDAVQFDLAPPLAHRVDRAGLAAWFGTWDGPVELEYRDVQIDVDGDLAFCRGFVHVSTRTSTGDDAAWWMRSTLCLRRGDEGWQIVHAHESVPFYMDGTFRAAIDLAP